jgi:hypothetical protein
MSSVVISGDTSGAITVAAPAVSGTNTLTLQAATATNAINTLDTAKAYNWNGLTTNTFIDFTGIPSWVKRITVMFAGLSTSGTNPLLIQGGNSGGIVSSGYISTSNHLSNASSSSGASSTTGFVFFNNSAAAVQSGIITLVNFSGSTWVSSHTAKSTTALIVFGGGDGSISTLDRVRITTTTFVDTFDAGSVNILYEG